MLRQWASAEIVASAAGAAGLLPLLVLVERRAVEPIIPYEVFASDSINALTCGLGVLNGLGQTAGAPPAAHTAARRPPLHA